MSHDKSAVSYKTENIPHSRSPVFLHFKVGLRLRDWLDTCGDA